MSAGKPPAQGDLFDPERRVYVPETEDQERAGWEAMLLRNLAEAPIVACHPGFIGAQLERLVARGLVTREDVGFRDPTEGIAEDVLATKAYRAHIRAYWKDPAHQYRYALKETDDASR